MSFYRQLFTVMLLGLGFCGCATSGGPAAVTPPPTEYKSYFYVGAIELALKSNPEASAPDSTRLTLNERVEMVEKGSAGWMLVRTADGRQGWANERDLKLSPISQLYVRRWGVRLKASPNAGGKSVARLRANDTVKLLDETPTQWAHISVDRTQAAGWVELSNLSVDRVTIRYRKSTRGTAAKPSEEPTEEEAAAAEEAPAPSSGIGPAPAEAAPPPKEAPPTHRKAKPGMFDPF